jgi:hypothetical protein
MGLIQESVAAATATVGVNLAAGKWWEKSNVWRRIRNIGLVGSTAVSDTVLEIFFGTTKVMEIRNSTAGAAKTPLTGTDVHQHSSFLGCAPNQSIAVVVKTAPSTNAIVLHMDIEDFRLTGGA